MEKDKANAKVHELDLHGKKLLRIKGVDEVSPKKININY